MRETQLPFVAMSSGWDQFLSTLGTSCPIWQEEKRSKPRQPQVFQNAPETHAGIGENMGECPGRMKRAKRVFQGASEYEGKFWKALFLLCNVIVGSCSTDWNVVEYAGSSGLWGLLGPRGPT